ncbi:MAG: YjbH domain-containing protein [Gammaproteobacteria bacterium]
MKHSCWVVRGVAALLCLTPTLAPASPSSSGQSGLIHMPDARIDDDGTLRIGGTHMTPYSAVWASVVALPRVELSGRFMRTAGVQGFRDRPGGFGAGFGTTKDKSFNLKIRLFDETDRLPAVAVGSHDFVGNAHFAAHYLVATKHFESAAFGAVDLTLGIGAERMDGVFGGARWHLPWHPDLRLIAEWDAYDYFDDYRARRVPAGTPPPRTGGLTFGVEYRFGWATAQLARQGSEFGATVSLSIPLQQPTFVPKTGEPPPLPVALERRPTLAEWHDYPASLQPLFLALRYEGFDALRAQVVADELRLAVGNGRITLIGRAAGRAARLAALHAPDGVTRLELTFQQGSLPVVTYRFADLALLRGWFEGTATGEALTPTLSVSYSDPDAWRALQADGLPWGQVWTPTAAPRTRVVRGSRNPLAPLSVYPSFTPNGMLTISPVQLGWFFNDPSGALKYDLYSMVSYMHRFSDSLYARVGTRITLAETVSSVEAESNSVLPHVRSDVARYHQEGDRVRLTSLYLGHVANPRERVYTSLSAGYLEWMYAGAGGEVLYLPETGNWAVDLAAFAVQKRDFDGGLGLQDYRTVTALASFHYRVPRHGLTFTTRVGRFLARDTGVRFEARRRFRSGFEIGAWYTHTDAKDITSPGSPSDPYYDKGVFLRFAIGPFLPFDSTAASDFSMAPWSRDGGQRVNAPGQLYEMLERRLLLNDGRNIWSEFGH